jgi:hypothetical protein
MTEHECSSAIRFQSRLIARAQRGDEQAFEALFNTYKRPVYSFVCA